MSEPRTPCAAGDGAHRRFEIVDMGLVTFEGGPADGRTSRIGGLAARGPEPVGATYPMLIDEGGAALYEVTARVDGDGNPIHSFVRLMSPEERWEWLHSGPSARPA